MSDITPLNRDMKKRQLKRRVITNPAMHQTQSEESEAIIRSARKKIWKKRFIIIIIVLIILVTTALGGYFYYRNHEFKNYSVGWQRDLDRSDSSFTEFLNFGSHILKYTKDGATCIDSKGKDVWIESYEMKNPIAATNGDYAAIADQQGNSIYICDKTGCLGVATTNLPIVKITISGKGVVAAVLEDQKANYIDYYRKDGTALDITIKGLLGGEVGYPLDISLSPDGTKLIGSFVYIENGALKSRVAFYDFSEIGKNVSSRFVGAFHDLYANSIIPRVRFLDEVYSCAFANDSLSFFSSSNALSPELIKNIPVEEEIKSIFYSPQYVGIIVEATSGEYDYRMDIYKSNGDKVFSDSFTYDYQGADIDGDHIFLYNEDSCRVYNIWGGLKFEGNFDFTVSKVTNGSLPNTLIVMGPQTMKEIKLQ